MPAEATPPGRRLVLPRWGWVTLALVVAFVYGRGVASDPLRWEEPRRALVAMEMIHRGDYVVPRLLGEPYLNKPPLQSWTIVLLSGFDARRVGPLSVRLPTLLAVAGIALLLWRLGTSSRSGPHVLPALVFVTFGILPQYGRPGEIDLLFTFWVTAALATFEWGRRRGSPLRQWVWSQGLVALGVLTKGLAVLFFHPPVLLLCWRRRREVPFVPWAFGAGLALLLGVLAAWVVPYAFGGPVLALRDRLGAEVAQRTIDSEGGAALRHVVTYPFLLLGAAAPWSLVLVAALWPRARAALKGLLADADAWRALCGATLLWGVAVFLFVPGTLPRYLLPVLPAAAVLVAAALRRIDRPLRPAWPWFVLGLAWLLALPWVAHERLSPLTVLEATVLSVVTTLLGLLAIGVGGTIARRTGGVTAALLTAGLLYGLVYAGIVEARTAERYRSFERSASELAPLVRAEVPLVVREGTDRRFTYPLLHRLDRLAVVRPPVGSQDVVGKVGRAPTGARLVRESGGFALWRVEGSP
jgi:4-amino-4-deoxy-L-arabinose transferase-like glycosyltransferase